MPKKNNKKESEYTNKIAIRTDENFLGYTGATPFVEFDENWNQMPLDRTKSVIPREHVTRGFRLAFEGGMLSILKPPKTSMILIIILLLTIIMGGVTAFLGFTNSQAMESGFNRTSIAMTTLTNKTDNISSIQDLQAMQIKRISEKLNITNNTIPTVGG